MKKQIRVGVELDELIGRTIEGIAQDYDNNLIIILDSDEYIVLEGRVDYDGYCEIMPNNDTLYPGDWMVKQNICTQDKLDMLVQARHEAAQETRRKRELAQLEKLMRKYSKA